MARVSTRVLEQLVTQQQRQPQPSPPAPPPAPPPAASPAKGGHPATPAGPAIAGRHTVLQRVAPQPTAGDTAQPRPRPHKAARTPQSAQPPSRPAPMHAASPAPASGSATQPAAPKQKTRPTIPDLIDRLAAAFPASCNFHAPTPLAIGIAPLLAEALGLPMPSVKAVLARWVNRLVYLQAMAAPASRRVNLDGSDAGEVEEGHRLHAAERLAVLRAAIQLEPMPAGAPRPTPSASR